MTAIEAGKADRQLESWKEIATFFDRDEKTVRRWEKELGMPVHRFPGRTKARVYALPRELREWAKRPQPNEAHVLEPFPLPDPGGQIEDSPSGPKLVLSFPSSGVESSADRLEARPKSYLLLLVAALVATLAIVAIQSRSSHSSPGGGQAVADGARNIHQPVAEAEALYLRGRYSWNKRTPEGLNQAVDYFTQAIVLDPAYAKPYVGLADSYNLLREYSAMPEEEAFKRAFAASSKAVELDPGSAEAHASLAFVLFYWKWDSPGAEREFQRAIALNPSYADAQHWYGMALALLGRPAEALATMNRAQQLDPSSPSIRADKGVLLVLLGQREEGIAMLRQMVNTDPGFASPHKYLALIYLADLDAPNYLIESRQSAVLLKDAAALAAVDAAEKGFRQRGVRGMLHSILEVQKQQFALNQVAASELAQTAALLGDEKAALGYLNEALRRHETPVRYIGLLPSLRSLHHSPEFSELLKQAGLPPLDKIHP